MTCKFEFASGDMRQCTRGFTAWLVQNIPSTIYFKIPPKYS